MNAQTVGHVNSVCQVTTVYRVFFQLTAAARFHCTSTEQIKVFSRTELSNLLARPVTLGLANIPSGPTHHSSSSETGTLWYVIQRSEDSDETTSVKIWDSNLDSGKRDFLFELFRRVLGSI